MSTGRIDALKSTIKTPTGFTRFTRSCNAVTFVSVANLQRKEYLSMNRNTRLSLLIFMLLVAASTAFAQQKKKPAPAVKEYTIEQFMNTVRIGGSSFSSDEKSILFFSNKSGIYNAYSVPVSGGAPVQLTNSTKESTFSVFYFPNDSRFLYTYDRGGNENSHLYLRELDGGERDLTPGEKVKANLLGWAHDRKSFFF